MKREQLENPTLIDINLNRRRQQISEQATSRATNKIRDILFNNWEKNLQKDLIFLNKI